MHKVITRKDKARQGKMDRCWSKWDGDINKDSACLTVQVLWAGEAIHKLELHLEARPRLLHLHTQSLGLPLSLSYLSPRTWLFKAQEQVTAFSIQTQQRDSTLHQVS